MTSQTHPPGCGCCCSARLNPGTDSGLTRREFLAGVGAVTVGGVMLASATAHAARHVSLVVEDSGAGMSDEVRERIFEPFFTTKAPEGGTGLGLTVVHAIVSAHGGEIGVESRPGRGSRFDVRLPRRSEAAAEGESP